MSDMGYHSVIHVSHGTPIPLLCSLKGLPGFEGEECTDYSHFMFVIVYFKIVRKDVKDVFQLELSKVGST